ncbi:MAG: hypothetical protein VKL39_17025 [Leptolyngbyaceae bacterium]|nr:hypothetical protein [Leptolyngbyaceae bacterium]
MNHSSLRPRQVFREGKLWDAVMLGTQLYKLVEFFSADQRDQAFERAVQLYREGCEAFISSDSEGYRVWVEAQSQSNVYRRRFT